MSAAEGFSADWLALREPADHAARNRDVQAGLLAHLGRLGETVGIVDMGCGTGSTFRALAPAIAAARPAMTQRWTLIDADAGLLAEAERQVSAFCGRHQFDVIVDCAAADLADGDSVEALVERAGCDLITGSALIDLVSAAWLERIAALAERYRIALLFALNYSGVEVWSPPHPLDAAILAAFNADQRRDKGFGPALGGAAVDHLRDRLATLPFEVAIGASDWRLGPEERSLIAMLAAGIAEAAAASGMVGGEAAADWRRSRCEAERVVVGHSDIFAAPR